MIAIIDYDAGNLRSVEKAFLHIGFDAKVTADHDEILSADKAVLPGVGAFGSAMDKLRCAGLDKTIKKAVESGKPFLGICLGLQLMYESSEESAFAAGLGILKGKIVKIPPKKGYKIPNIGWNKLNFEKDSMLMSGIEKDSYVYFVHSYYLETEDKGSIIATIDYSARLEVAVEYKNIFLTQFHPEKSGDIGLSMLSNFAKYEVGR